MKQDLKIQANHQDRSQAAAINTRLPEIVPPLLKWYDSNARILPWREIRSPYGIWISEIMLQQTRVEAVKSYFDRWMAALPDLPSLASASEAQVLKLWEGLGYYSRARNIRRTAQIVMEKYNGSLPASFEELHSLPGIGEYTAGAVGSIAFHLPVPCVDGNVLRVVTRLTAEKSDIGSAATKKLLTGWVRDIIPKDRPGDFNQAMMELGATVCLPNGLPKCEICPVASLCRARIEGRVTEYPVKSGKPPRKIEKKTVLVIIKNNETALKKRPEAGLLANLWEFPNFPGTISEKEVREILSSMGLIPISLTKLKDTKHIFTHIEWHMCGYLAISDEQKIPEADFQWVGMDILDSQLTLPAAFKAYYQILKRLMNKES